MLLVPFPSLPPHTLQVKDMLPMKDNDSALFQPWVDHGGYGSPIHNHFYVWNLTNAAEYYDGTELPKLEKIGPFIYRMFAWKEDLEWFGDNGDDKEFISYRYHNYNVFLPERSTTKWSTDDLVTVPNLALQGFLLQLREAFADDWFIYDALMDIIKDAMKVEREALFVTRPIQEIVFGYKDPIIQNIIDALLESKFVKNNGIEIPPIDADVALQQIDTKQFYQNKSVQYSGTSDYKKTTIFKEWCGMSDLSKFWPDAPELTGGDGWNFPPGPGDRVKLFIDGIPAVIPLDKKDKVDILGIHSHRYFIAEEVFSNSSEYGRTHDSFCPGGLLNVSRGQGAPVFISNPHFEGADPVLHQYVDMPPADSDRDSTWIAIEPITGSSVAAQEVIQINLRMDDFSCNLTGTLFHEDTSCKIKLAYIPLMLANQYTYIPPNEADALKAQVCY